jgi:GTPase
MRETKKRLRFLLFEVTNTHYHQDEALKHMMEMEQLVGTYGGLVVEKAVQHRVHPHPNTYIGTGKVEWLKERVKELEIDVVVFNAVVKPSQLFRVEKQLWEVDHLIKVWDKVDLVLEIFDRHASSKEAKLQIELARLRHTGPRIYGLGRTELSRQGGGIGQRGGYGETNIEFERRMIKDRMVQIQRELKRVTMQKRERVRYRKEKGFGPVALVGYTSAGKTTLFNALTGKDKQTNPSLFTTLDTVVGKMKIAESPLPVLISDTIGFMADLPPELIEAFTSTLMESMEAELILHVVDAADPERQQKIEVVTQILQNMQITQPVITVLNKCDLIQDTTDTLEHELEISATTGKGIKELKELIVRSLVPETEAENRRLTLVDTQLD